MAKGIKDVIYSLLSNNASVNNIVVNKIFPYLAQDNVDVPYLVFDLTGLEPTDCKDGVSGLDTLLFDIEMYHDDPDLLETLSTNVRTVLDRHSGTTETVVVQSIQYTGEDGGYSAEDKVFIKVQTYKARIEK